MAVDQVLVNGTSIVGYMMVSVNMMGQKVCFCAVSFYNKFATRVFRWNKVFWGNNWAAENACMNTDIYDSEYFGWFVFNDIVMFKN